MISEHDLLALRQQVIILQVHIDWLTEQILKQSPRRQFQKKPSIPLCDMDTTVLHVVKPKPQTVGRVVVVIGKNDEREVKTYDQEGREISSLCGSFREVGLDVLDKAGTKRWEVQYPPMTQ